ncbi:MAG: extracellular solute-binding protein [Clostridiales bacterium]|nr:extracellular solute-binding protein [Clostridiales bacterium]
MLKKFLSVLLAVMMILSLAACDEPQEGETTAPAGPTSEGETTAAPTEQDLPYEFGLGTTFRADEPLTYSMFLQDASWYAMVDTWETEGVFKKIFDLTNVKLDITKYDWGDYSEGIKLAIAAGQGAYIIPKIYDESAYVGGGAVLPVSDYTQYMPYFTDFVEKYNMQPELETITQADGKFYRLPGMLEAPLQDYTLMVRSDIFAGAGYDIKELEKDWTWESLVDVLKDVKAYMVQEGMIKENDYVWSDLWAGQESGQGTGGNLLKLIGASYGVPAGWASGNGMEFDEEKGEWYFAPISDDYKEFVTVVNTYIKEGLLDPETFTQMDADATGKFYRGETALISVNRSQISVWRQGLDEILGEGNHETYVTVYPMGNNPYIAERNRLENGVMISTNALNDLGEDGVIELFRFVDWLFYSPEAYTLIKWGVEGETFEYVEDPDTGLQVKQLLPGFKCGGLGIGGAEEDVDIRLQWGYAGGNFWYGGTVAEMADNFTPELIDFYSRLSEYRELAPANPPVKADSDEQEMLAMIQAPLMQEVAKWTLNFVLGQVEINDENWNEYIQACKGLQCDSYVYITNDIYEGQ